MEWLIKREEASLSDYGKYPGSRNKEELLENGIIILDKPPGPTSHKVDEYVKKILNIKKASHGGTLDPKVTGVLVIALENATKLMPILLKSRKEYVGLIHLHKDIDKKEIEKMFKEFIGKQKQLPPKKSAVARRIRTREVYNLEILEIEGKDVLFRIECEAGFYVRRFADDLGKKLKVGAHLLELRRTRSGIFSEDQTITLQKLIDEKEKVVLPMEIALEGIGKIIISDKAIPNIVNGSPLYIPGILRLTDKIEKGDWVGMFSLKGEIVAIGKANIDSKEIFKKKKGVAVKTDRVLIKKGVYPKL